MQIRSSFVHSRDKRGCLNLTRSLAVANRPRISSVHKTVNFDVKFSQGEDIFSRRKKHGTPVAVANAASINVTGIVLWQEQFFKRRNILETGDGVRSPAALVCSRCIRLQNFHEGVFFTEEEISVVSATMRRI